MKRQTIWRVFIALMLLGCSGAMVSCSKDLPDETFVPSKYALIDLHLHLDGSLTVDDAIYMASVDGVTLPSSRSEIEKLLVCPDDCESLNDYIKCFDLPVSIMQSKETIAYSVRSLVKRLDAQGLIYAEIRYAPQQQLQKGLTQDEVVAARSRVCGRAWPRNTSARVSAPSTSQGRKRFSPPASTATSSLTPASKAFPSPSMPERPKALKACAWP